MDRQTDHASQVPIVDFDGKVQPCAKLKIAAQGLTPSDDINFIRLLFIKL